MKKIEVINNLYKLVNDLDDYEIIVGKTSNDEVIEIIVKKVKETYRDKSKLSCMEW